MNLFLVELGLKQIKKKYLKLKKNLDKKYFKALKVCNSGYEGAHNAMVSFGKERYAANSGFEDETPFEIKVLGEYRDWFSNELIFLQEDKRAPFKKN